MKKTYHILSILIIISSYTSFSQDIVSIEQGVNYFEQDQYNEAKAIFQKEIDSDSKDFRPYLYLGRIFIDEENYDAAISNLKTSTELAPENSDCYLWLGTAYLSKLQISSYVEKGILAGKTLDNYHKAISLDSMNLEAHIRIAYYYLNAPSIAGGSSSKAKKHAAFITKYDPDAGNQLMAKIYMHREEYDNAEELYKKLIAENPESSDLYYDLGMIYQKQKKYNDAFGIFEKALTVDPKAYNSMYQIGRTAVYSESETDKGIKNLREYLKTEHSGSLPGHDAAYWRLGMLYEIKGNKAKAEKEYKKALKLNPDNETYSDALENL